MSKSIIFDKAIDYIDEHIKEDKEEIRKGLFNGQDKSKNAFQVLYLFWLIDN